MERNQRQGDTNHSEVEKIVQAVAHGELTRRQFIERGIVLGLSLTAIAAVLGACGEGDADEGATPEAMDTTLPESITLFNWSDYMSPQVLKDFEDTYGVKVREVFYDGNEALYAKLSAGATGYDVILPTDMWVTVLSKSDLIQPLDMSKIPNWKYVTDEVFQKPPFDDPDEQGGKKYSVPYMFGTTGYAAILEKVAAPANSWEQLWDEAYKGEISMLNTPRETLGVGLIRNGYSRQHHSQEELDAAVDDAHRAEAPRAQVRLHQHAAEHRPGTRPDPLLGRRRRPRDQGHPAGERAVRPSGGGVHRVGRRHGHPEGDRERLRGAPLPQPHARPQAGRAGGRLHRLPLRRPGRGAVLHRPDAGRDASDPRGDRQRQARRGRRRGPGRCTTRRGARSSPPDTTTGAGRRGRAGGRGARRRQEGTEWNRPSAPDWGTARSSR